jgi:hypothetical protein
VSLVQLPAVVDTDICRSNTDTWLLVSKTLAWDGGGRPSGPIRITEAMSTVPIPAAGWLMGAGLVGLMAMRRARS